MPPEQAAGQTGRIDARSDVYGLGALLYELLTGHPPFRAASTMETLRLVIENEVVPPRRLNPALPADLETICLKCLEKDPDRRYQTAQELGDELGRFIRDEPILARPIAHVEKVWRWCRRKPAVAAFATATIALLLAVAIGSPVATWRITTARNAERVQRERAEANSDDLVKSLYAADMRTAWQALQEDNLLVARESIYKYLPALGIRISANQIANASVQAGALHPRPVTRELLGWEWRRLWALCQGDEKFTLHGDGLEIRCAVFSPDSRLVATGREKMVYVTDAHTKQQLAALGGFSDVIDNSAIAFSNDGKYLAAKGGTNVLIWEVGHWESPSKQLSGRANNTHGNAVLFSPDNQRFVTRVEGGLGVWDTTTWQRQLIPGSSGLGMYLRYTADGKWLAASEWNDLKILDAESFAVVRVVPREQEGNFRMFALDACAKQGLLAAGYHDGIVRVWEVENWREVARFQPHPSFTFGLAFSPDGNLLVTGGSDQLLKVWEVASLIRGATAAHAPEPLKRPIGHPDMEFPGRLPSRDGPQPNLKLQGHHASIHGLSFAPDGRSVISASKDGTAKLWNPLQVVKTDALPDSAQPVWFSPDASRLITRNHDVRLHVWDTRRREDLGATGPNLDDSKAWAISEDGKVPRGRPQKWRDPNLEPLKAVNASNRSRISIHGSLIWPLVGMPRCSRRQANGRPARPIVPLSAFGIAAPAPSRAPTAMLLDRWHSPRETNTWSRRDWLGAWRCGIFPAVAPSLKSKKTLPGSGR
jgi:WD40 repeat protein